MESYTPLLAINDTSPPGNIEMYQNVTSICTFVSQLLVHRRRFSTRNLRILYHQDRSLASRPVDRGREHAPGPAGAARLMIAPNAAARWLADAAAVLARVCVGVCVAVGMLRL